MLINIEMCLNSQDLKIYKSNLSKKEHTKKSGGELPPFPNNQTKEEHHG